jgi:hypothetical protein
MRRPTSLIVLALATATSLAAGNGCSAANDKSPGGAPHDSGTPSTTDTGAGDDTGTGTGDDVGLSVDDLGQPETAPSGGCKAADDCDGDGYKKANDCNDNDSTINPEAYDFPGDGIDNDCDGTVDDPVTNCGPNTTAASDASNYGRTLDLCVQNSVTNAGKKFDPLVAAAFGKITGTFPPATINTNYQKALGRLAKFGDNAARNGADLVAMSTGVLGDHDPRTSANSELNTTSVMDPCSVVPINAADCKSLTSGTSQPPIGGFSTLSAHDYQEIKLTVKVPSNANAMLFDFSFFSTEFNEFWKSDYNDAFFAIVTSQKLKGINVAKDANGLGITVNSGYFQICPAPPGPSGLASGKAGGLANCVGEPTDPAGKIFGSLNNTGFAGELQATPSTNDTTMGFVDTSGLYVYGGSSGWLTSRFGVTPGETMTIRFIIFDSGDGVLDSAVVLDNLRWEKAPPSTVDPVVERPPQ